jgi:site-specific DNA recombinase
MRYFLYCRKSSDSDDRQILSIEAQLLELRDYALKNNLEVIKEFTESKTAKKPGREVFNEMISGIEAGKANGIIAWNPDRLARNSVDGGRIIYLIDEGIITDLKFPTAWFDNSP